MAEKANNQLDQLTDQLITQEVLYQEALNRSLHTDATVKQPVVIDGDSSSLSPDLRPMTSGRGWVVRPDVCGARALL